MSFLNKLKTAANQTKLASTSLATNSVGTVWGKYGDSICETVLRYATLAAKKGKPFIVDDAKYKANVIDPAWEVLPTPVRLLGRDRLNWDAIFLAGRSKVFLIEGEDVTVHPEAKQRINNLFAGMLPKEQLPAIAAESSCEDAN
ncbi:hypothetical protein [Allorhodopirellula heiligendammensis]|uniref:Uncharacterized protein n=1 Tax=Allorhodopirellula heiligendammensis TaxID=2714739 RepID=A0A5C6BEC5_9BACT|nr:hypothetical protein [Allorhodopirellula heiligendammensis]TWU09831.1 hypothetical protein Poly21_53760 [Allorhodopirellula heiligendammensis]